MRGHSKSVAQMSISCDVHAWTNAKSTRRHRFPAGRMLPLPEHSVQYHHLVLLDVPQNFDSSINITAFVLKKIMEKVQFKVKSQILIILFVETLPMIRGVQSTLYFPWDAYICQDMRRQSWRNCNLYVQGYRSLIFATFGVVISRNMRSSEYFFYAGTPFSHENKSKKVIYHMLT
jgi:hypothetical protein